MLYIIDGMGWIGGFGVKNGGVVKKKWRKNLVMSKKGCNFALAIERLAERCNLSRRSLG